MAERELVHASRKWLRPANVSDGSASSVHADIDITLSDNWNYLDASISFHDCYRSITYTNGANDKRQAGKELTMLRKLQDELGRYIQQYELAAERLPNYKSKKETDDVE